MSSIFSTSSTTSSAAKLPSRSELISSLKPKMLPGGDCPMCLEAFGFGEDAESGVELPCGHNVGLDCLKEWLGQPCFDRNQSKDNCPICRVALCEAEFVCSLAWSQPGEMPGADDEDISNDESDFSAHHMAADRESIWPEWLQYANDVAGALWFNHEPETEPETQSEPEPEPESEPEPEQLFSLSELPVDLLQLEAEPEPELESELEFMLLLRELDEHGPQPVGELEPADDMAELDIYIPQPEPTMRPALDSKDEFKGPGFFASRYRDWAWPAHQEE